MNLKLKSLFGRKRSQRHECSFCGKDHSRVLKVIQGPGCYICNECVVLFSYVLGQECTRELKTKLAAILREATKRQSEPGASPNGGPAQRLGNSEVNGGPPSVT